MKNIVCTGKMLAVMVSFCKELKVCYIRYYLTKRKENLVHVFDFTSKERVNPPWITTRRIKFF